MTEKQPVVKAEKYSSIFAWLFVLKMQFRTCKISAEREVRKRKMLPFILSLRALVVRIVVLSM